jgi:hypothetical protein
VENILLDHRRGGEIVGEQISQAKEYARTQPDNQEDVNEKVE